MNPTDALPEVGAVTKNKQLSYIHVDKQHQ